MRVARQTKIQQHRDTIGADQNVGRLEVQVANILLVQTVHRTRHGRTQSGHPGHGQVLALIEPVLQCLALDILHHKIGQTGQIACGHKARHMGPLQLGQDLRLDFKADDVLSAIGRCHARNFHGHGELGLPATAIGQRGIHHLVNVRHAACMQTGLDFKAVDQVSRIEKFQRPSYSRCAKYSGKSTRRIAADASAWL